MDEMKKLIIGSDEFEMVDGASRSRIDGTENTIQSMRKKILAMTGTLKDLTKQLDTITTVGICTISQITERTDDNNNVTEKWMNIGIGNATNAVAIDLFEDNKANFGSIRYLRGYNPYKRLYLVNTAGWNNAVDAAVANVKFYFDGVEKSIYDINSGDSFTSLVIFKQMSTTTVYIHEINSTGIKLFILTDSANFQRSEIYASSTAAFESVYDGGELAIYAAKNTGKTLTVRSDTEWTSGKWLKADIYW